jgi:D-alanine-D-alanine ligase-like ATP-grasp enzyme
VKKNFNAKEYKYCFEVFGYDFIVDDKLNMWLIEVNTNPCIEESSPLLATIIPRMLNDAYKLTVD